MFRLLLAVLNGDLIGGGGYYHPYEGRGTHHVVLGGSQVLISRVIRRVTMVIPLGYLYKPTYKYP